MKSGRALPRYAQRAGDGEDFELIAAASPADGERLLRTQPIAGVTPRHVGEFVASGLWIDEASERRLLPPTGYVHRFG